MVFAEDKPITGADLYLHLFDEEHTIVERILQLIRQQRKESLGDLAHTGVNQEFDREAALILFIREALASGMPPEEFVQRYPSATEDISRLLRQRPIDELGLSILTSNGNGSHPSDLLVQEIESNGSSNGTNHPLLVVEIEPSSHPLQDFEPAGNDEVVGGTGRLVELEENEIVWPEDWQPVLEYLINDGKVTPDDFGVKRVSRTDLQAVVKPSLQTHIDKLGKKITSIKGSEMKVNGVGLSWYAGKTQHFTLDHTLLILEHVGLDNVKWNRVRKDNSGAKPPAAGVNPEGTAKLGEIFQQIDHSGLKNYAPLLKKWLEIHVQGKQDQFIDLKDLKQLFSTGRNAGQVNSEYATQIIIWRENGEKGFTEIPNGERPNVHLSLNLVFQCLVSENLKHGLLFPEWIKEQL